MSLGGRVPAFLAPTFLSSRCRLENRQEVVIEEMEPSGCARVTMSLPAATECLILTLEKGQGGADTQWFKFLKSEKCADGAFLARVGEHRYEAYVIECKATVDSSNWDRAKTQMAGTVARLRALAGVFEVQITRIRCYTAYRHDRLTDALKADPAELRPGVGTSFRTADLLDWQRDVADLGPLGELPHRKVPLTQDADKIWCSTVPVSPA